MAEIYYKVTDTSGNLKFIGEADSFSEYEEDQAEILEDSDLRMEIIEEKEYNKLSHEVRDMYSQQTTTQSDNTVSFTTTSKYNLQKSMILTAFAETGNIPSVDTLEEYYQWFIK